MINYDDFIGRSRWRRASTFGLIVVAGWFANLLWAADEPPLGAEVSDKVEFQERAKANAASYEIQIESSGRRNLSLQPDSILRWSNPVGGKEAHGEVFVWTDRGRPEVVLSNYEFVGMGGVLREHHEFSSLSQSKLQAKRENKTVWSPSVRGLEMKPVPDAASPAESSRVRLREMRTIANGFEASKTTREGVTRALRLLPQPIYRYDGHHPTTLDAAIFAFVEGTDPEVLLLIEARTKDLVHEWNYGFARLNSIQMSASYLEKPVWEVSVLPWGEALDRADKPYTVFRIP